jgi:hypothetical protein
MTIEGKLENWQELHKLALRTHLGDGEVEIDGKKIPLSFSLNIDNKAIFVEFPDGIKVTYHTTDIIEDAIASYKGYLATQTKQPSTLETQELILKERTKSLEITHGLSQKELKDRANRPQKRKETK